MNESLKITGNLQIIKRDSEGNIVDTRSIPNLIVTSGKNEITKRIVGVTGNVFGGDFGRMAIGSSSNAAALSDTTLGGTEVQSISPLQNVISSDTITYTAVFVGKNGTPEQDGKTHSIREAAIFNNPLANVGTMLCRTTFSAVSKEPTSSLTVNWNITVS